MIIRAIAPDWLLQSEPERKRVHEADLTQDQILDLNAAGYNIYYLPNPPTIYDSSTIVDGTHIDKFEYVFVDMDLKDGHWKTAAQFIEGLNAGTLAPTSVVLSGNGVHAYWKITDLTAMDYLNFQRSICRYWGKD